MKTLCVIPARGGSSRVKRKNVRSLRGLPLIVYTIRQAKSARGIDKTVVSTDDEEIAEVAERERGVGVIMRAPELARDDTPIYFALRHAVRSIERSRRWLPDITIWLQPNVPFREKGLIEAVEMKLEENYDKTDSVATVYEVDQHPEAMKVINNGLLECREKSGKVYFRTQELPKCYMLDGSVVAIKTNVLLDEARPVTDGHFYMGRMMPYVHSFPYTMEADTEQDFTLLEYILDRQLITLKDQ